MSFYLICLLVINLACVPRAHGMLLTDYADKGDVEGVERLLKKFDTNINAKNEGGVPALIMAAYKGHEDIVKLLLAEKKIDINITDPLDYTALMRAADQGRTNIVRQLLAAKANDKLVNFEKKTALQLAQAKGHTEVVKLLEAASRGTSASEQKANTQTETSREPALSSPKAPTAHAQENVEPVPVSSSPSTLSKEEQLMQAVEHGKIEDVKKLLAAHVNVNWQDPQYGYTALIEAASKGEKEIVQLLLDAGADINIRNKEGATALDRAKNNDRFSVIPLLTDLTGKTPEELLMKAVEDRNVDRVKGLLKQSKSLNINWQDPQYGYTALIEAASKDQKEIVKLLLDAGADASIRNKEGKAALDRAHDADVINLLKGASGRRASVTGEQKAAHAETRVEPAPTPLLPTASKEEQLIHVAERGEIEDVKKLLAAGININWQDSKSGDTALIEAVLNGREEIVKLLLDAGVDTDLRNKEGKTALVLAYGRGNSAIQDMLLGHAIKETAPKPSPQEVKEVGKELTLLYSNLMALAAAR
jgi:ankyrin repeat protein